ncbi:MAG: hypothetical protein CMK32_07810 [Porticoccaceae bacterium]|nr:hypothetical protein [Porticoccaceae bacterium]
MAIDEDLICPKCKHKHFGGGNPAEENGEHECSQCGFKFFVTVDLVPTYDCECLEHEFTAFNKLKNFKNARLCKYCGKMDFGEFSRASATS